MSRALWLFLLGRVNQYQLLTLSNFSHYQFNNLSIVSDDLFPRGSQLKTLVESIPANERFLKTRVYSLYETLRDFCELLPFFCDFDDSIYDNTRMIEKIQSGFSLISFNKLKRHFSQTLTVDQMKTFRSSVVKDIKKLDYLKYKELCLLSRQDFPHLFLNDKYTDFERQNVGLSAFLRDNSNADEIFNIIITLTFNNHSNTKREALYGKRFPSGHTSYICSEFSYAFRPKKIGIQKAATPGSPQHAFVDDKTSSESGRSDNSSLNEEVSFGRYIDQLSHSENLCRWPIYKAAPYSVAEASSINCQIYIRYIKEIIGEDSIILKQPQERIAHLNNYHGSILLYHLFPRGLTHNCVSEFLNAPGYLGSTLYDGRSVAKEFLLSLLNTKEFSKKQRLSDQHINHVLNFLEIKSEANIYVGDSFTFETIFTKSDSKSSYKLWHQMLSSSFGLIPFIACNHWCLIVFERKEKMIEFFMINSLPNAKFSAKFFMDLKRAFENYRSGITDHGSSGPLDCQTLEITFSEKQAYIQGDEHSCGFHMLYYSACIIYGFLPSDPLKCFDQFKRCVIFILYNSNPVFHEDFKKMPTETCSDSK